MALTQMTDDVAIIAALADLPNATSGLTAAQLKAKFDVASGLLKTYLNSTLLPEIETATNNYSDSIINAKSYYASGDGETTTTGSITSGLTALTVAATTTFSQGQGISVAGAGAAGATLVTTISSISGLVITLAVSASTTVAGAVVSHDDTVAIQAAIDYCVTTDNKLFFPAGTYLITSKLTLNDGAKVYGSGMMSTIIKANVIDDVAIELVGDGAPTYPFYKIELCDLHIMGNATSTTSSTAIGGVYINGTEHVKVERVKASLFCSAGWNTIGNPATEKRYGFMVSGVVGAVINDCYGEYNDVGFRVQKGSVSVNTSTTFHDCASRINRTHGVLWEDTMTTVWNGGAVESNAGLVSFQVTNTGASEYNNAIRGVHFEANHRLTTIVDGDGTREIKVTGVTANNIILDSIFMGSNYDYAIELSGTTGATISNCLTAGLHSFKLNTTCIRTFISGGLIQNLWTDLGIGTKLIGLNIIINDDADLTTSTPNVSNKSYAKLTAGTVTNLTLGSSGQIVTLEGQTGTVLSSATNFILKNGSPYMKLADGSIVILRKDKTSGKWVLIGHEPSVAKAVITNAANPLIDDRPFWIVDDTNVTAINMNVTGYDGQEITILSKNTGANVTTFNNSAYLSLAGGTCALGENDTLRLIFDYTLQKWFETGRSVNT